ncbi:MAG TPA: TetR/AcrR family transcriptional regulator C-terminal domain-containing protein [Candidatus Saccharimonadales bacterium]|nr:TetR/AcrR family transcriptional regulator C-terminal domain-containing protein [Candidatus Saccharimonadales bacterium]
MNAHPQPFKTGGLERDRVVQVALALLHEVGYNGLTLRKLADRLGVKAAALYWHFSSKQDLVDAMAAAIILQEFSGARFKSRDWRAVLAAVAQLNRQALLRYRDGAQVVAHADMPHDAMLKGLEQLLTLLMTQGFTRQLATASFFTIIRYTLGCVFAEQAGPQLQPPLSRPRQERIQALTLRYPTLAKNFGEHAAQGAAASTRQFEHGLDLILDGIATQLDSIQAKA